MKPPLLKNSPSSLKTTPHPSLCAETETIMRITDGDASFTPSPTGERALTSCPQKGMRPSPSPFQGEGRGEGRGEGGAITFRRQLRKTQTDAEKLLWSRLRNRLFLGLKFRRQHDVGKFIADFCCPDQKLILEIDGGQHSENKLLDQKRTEYLEMRGYRVLRFWNHDVLGSLDSVLEKIQLNLKAAPHPSPLPTGERELDNFSSKGMSRPSPSPYFQGEGRGEG